MRAPRVIEVSKFREGYENDTDPLEGKTTTFDFMDAPDAYALINVAAGFSIKTKNAQYNIRASAENLLDTSYREYSNRFRYYADDLGRNFILSLKFIF
jgi:iron complex outermembrane recepter protein